MEAICPPTPVAQERSAAADLETLLLNWLPVGTVTEEDAASSDPSADSVLDPTPLQTETTAQQLRCPLVVAQTRPMEGCNPVLPQRLRRGRDVLTEDGVVAVDTRKVSAASETVVSREIHRKSECVPTGVPTLAAAPQTASEGYSTETSRLRLHGPTLAGGRVSRIARD